MMKISTKYKNKIYYHADRPVDFGRIMGGIGWPSEAVGCVVVIGESGKDKYVLGEAMCKTFGDLLTSTVKLQQILGVSRWHTRYIPGAEDYLAMFNSNNFRGGLTRLNHVEEPIESDDYLRLGIELIMDAVRPGDKSLHFFDESSLPSELQSLMGSIEKMKAIDNPVVSALGSVVSYMHEFKQRPAFEARENSPY